MKGNLLRVRLKQNRRRGFFLLLSQADALHGSDAGSDGDKTAWDFVIENRQTRCSK